ncbi:MAG TPA: Nramp family divalent metal transporter [Firmicutes bacterium]|nr:Nramp family divalent metal transporter [Candidatus Fermentithermobacillaceae bacterium]
MLPPSGQDFTAIEVSHHINRSARDHCTLSARARKSLIRAFKYIGPAFVVSVAYMDPGNFATNITAGSRFNYSLIWVILWSNLFAIFLQTLSAKLGIATGESLPEHCRKLFSRRTNWFLWTVSMLAAAATELAEVLGGALGFYLLFGIPLTPGALLTVAISCGILALGRYGQEKVELAISGLLGIIGISYVIELFLCDPDWPAIFRHTLVPYIESSSLLVAAGMLGATVMPHVIFLHSHLVKGKRNANPETQEEHLSMEKIDVLFAMNVAFLINGAMVVVSAATFFSRGIVVDSIELAHQTLRPLLGNLSSVAFATALLASGLSSSAVGAYAGEVIIGGFVESGIPIWTRRVLTIVPGLLIISLRLNPVEVLVLSQVTLSFALPAAVIPLLLVTGRREIMGRFANSTLTSLIGWIVVALIIGLNGALLYCTLFHRTW